MRLKFAFFARAADISQDGTFAVLGAGLDKLRAPGFPCSAAITLVANVGLSPDDRQRRNAIILEAFDPAGERMAGPIESGIQPPPPQPGQAIEDELGVTCIFGLFLTFPVAGAYRFRLTSDLGEEFEEQLLRIERAN
jgi:hypothetical protein